MAEHGVKQVDVAQVLDTTGNYVNKKINGTGSDFTLYEARRLVRHFGMPGSIFLQ
ncbi:hypothetical protein [Oenococcus oeni]|uniref:hypothetical protein n=1 Tax=Oenococcus oeni TaxID=1247 RepID=UPI0021B39A4A|nr:hypothetical protein [Oenococcus oeni]